MYQRSKLQISGWVAKNQLNSVPSLDTVVAAGLEAMSETRTLNGGGVPVTVEEAAKRMLEWMAGENHSRAGIRNMRQHLNRFKRDFGSSDLRRVNIDLLIHRFEQYAKEPPNPNEPHKLRAPVTRKNYQNGIKQFFNRCKRWGYLSRDKATAMDAMETVKTGGSEVKLWPVHSLSVILEHVSKGQARYRAAVAIAALAGLRITEVARLQWQDVLWDAGYIRVPVKSSKNNKSRRTVPISPALRAWLEPVRKESGPLTKARYERYVVEHIPKLSRAAGLDHVPNGYRHTCISVWLATGELIGEVSEWCDNSPEKIRSNYRGELTKERAEIWLNTFPKDHIININEARESA